GCTAPPAQRRAILTATAARPGEPVFGAPVISTHSSAYLQPGSGQRRLATVVLPARGIVFSASHPEGAEGPAVRVAVRRSAVRERLLPVKDHFLLRRAEEATPDLRQQVQVLNRIVREMGEQVAARLGLSRAFPPGVGRGPAHCWLMADGFFSLTDPQP